MKKADGGTLFLDEISTLSASSQARLLKSVEDGIFYPVGSDKPVRSNFRLISATCDDLSYLVAQKKFREDLYYRITGINLYIPPLSERREDIEHLISKFQTDFCLSIMEIEEEAKLAIMNYKWAGNVRELKRLFELFRSHTRPFLRHKDLPADIRNQPIEKQISTNDPHDKMLEHIKKNGFDKFVQDLRYDVFKALYKGNGREFIRLTGMSAPTVQKLKERYEKGP